MPIQMEMKCTVIVAKQKYFLFWTKVIIAEAAKSGIEYRNKNETKQTSIEPTDENANELQSLWAQGAIDAKKISVVWTAADYVIPSLEF